MTIETPVQIDDLLRGMAEAAGQLDDVAARSAVEVVRERIVTPKTQILIAGSIGSGRATLVNALLDRPDLLPTSPIPKLPIPIVVRYGPTEIVSVLGADGVQSVVSPSQLRSLLYEEAAFGTELDTSRVSVVKDAGAAPARLEVATPSPLLATADLRIEALGAHRDQSTWNDLLRSVDFVFLVLDAAALLSRAERELVQHNLAADFGLQRVAILVNRMDRVTPEEQEAVLDHVHTFLGPYESQPVILPLSAAGILKARRDGFSTEDAGTRLRVSLDVVMRDIVDSGVHLRAESLRAGLEESLDVLEAAAARRRAALSVDLDRLEEARRTCGEREEWLQQRAQRMQRRVETFVGVVVKEHLLREIESFAEMLRRRLPEDIREVGNVTLIRRHLPGYMESVWTDFLSRLTLGMERELQDEAETVSRMIESDLNDLLEGVPVDIVDFVSGFDVMPDRARTVVMPRRGKHHISGITKILSLQGYFMLMFDPVLGALSIAASHILRRFNQRDLTEAEQNAIAATAVEAVQELQRDLSQRIEAEFNLLTLQIGQEVTSLYTQAGERVIETLDQLVTERERAAAQLVALDRLERRTFPSLRRGLSALNLGVPS